MRRLFCSLIAASLVIAIGYPMSFAQDAEKKDEKPAEKKEEKPAEKKEEKPNWPFPNKLLQTTPLDKLPFNPDNHEDAPL